MATEIHVVDGIQHAPGASRVRLALEVGPQALSSGLLEEKLRDAREQDDETATAVACERSYGRHRHRFAALHVTDDETGAPPIRGVEGLTATDDVHPRVDDAVE